MWIFTKDGRAINSDQITCFFKNEDGTYADTGVYSFNISEFDVMEEIIRGIVNENKYMWVR